MLCLFRIIISYALPLHVEKSKLTSKEVAVELLPLLVQTYTFFPTKELVCDPWLRGYNFFPAQLN